MDDSHTLSVHRFLLRTALAAGNIFAWILIFHALYFSGETPTGALLLTAFAYVFMQLAIFFLTPLAALNLPHGTARSMLCAVLAQAAAFLWLGASSIGIFGTESINLLWGIVGFVVLSAIYRAFYWVPYTTATMYVGSGWSSRTRFLLEVFLALVPLCSALFISGYTGGTWFVLVGAAGLAFLAALPLIRITDSYERFDWGYIETIRALFARPHRSVLSRSFLEGIQGAGLLFIWPLTVFMLLDWSYFLLGVIVTITLLLSLVMRKTFRSTLESWNLHRSHRVSAALAASSWVLRVVVFSPVSVVVADTLYHLSVPAKRYGVDPIAHEQSADNSHYIDEYTALKELGSALGRVALGLALMALLFFASPFAALACALLLSAGAAIAAIYARAGSSSAF